MEIYNVTLLWYIFLLLIFKQMMTDYFKHFLILLRIRKYGRESITFFNMSSGIIDVRIINYNFTAILLIIRLAIIDIF